MIAYLRWWFETFRCDHSTGSYAIYGDERNRMRRGTWRRCFRCGRDVA